MNKTAVITGATKGIGRAISEYLAKEGYDLAVNARNEEDLQEMKRSIMDAHPGITVHVKATDMSIKSQVLDFGKWVLDTLPQIDVLVNNAGIFIPGVLCEEEDGALESMINTNLYSAYHLTRSLIGSMKKKKVGHIFNMCSIASKIAYPNGGSYSISKFALLGFSKVLREELKEDGIKVVSILPGATWSNSWKGVDLPTARLMQATDIAEAVLGAIRMSPSAVVEEIILRPQLGDL